MAWKYRPHARYYSIWRAEIGRSVRKNDKNSLLLLTMPASFIATSHLMFSDTPLTIFWANYVEDEDDYESLALSKFNWVATGPCVVGTCHIFLRDRVRLLQVCIHCTTEHRSRITRFHKDAHKIACFLSYFGRFDILHTIANCIPYCHFLIALVKSTIQTHNICYCLYETQNSRIN